jgi:hypothetical protein
MSAEKPLEFCVRSISCPGLSLIMVKKIKPKLIIKYSRIYDGVLHQFRGLDFKDERTKYQTYCNGLQKMWERRDLFSIISRISGLPWKEKEIPCYIVKSGACLSDPLTVVTDSIQVESTVKRKGIQVRIIIHELIHRLLDQNADRVKYPKRYNKLSETVREHVLVHAIQKEVLATFYLPEKRKYIGHNVPSSDPKYAEAWDIVNKEGAKKIIKECIKK